jgi:DNA-binding GntR family transcriptional regulator
MHAAGFWRCDPVSPVDQNELSVPSLVDVLHAAIRDRILKGDIEPGASVTEMSIATQYSVARPTAKAAMERLVVDGLLRRSTNKTARVPLLDTEDVRDLYFSRELIERSVVERLAMKRLVPDEAEKYVTALRDAADEPTVTAAVSVDLGFHRSLVTALNSPRLIRLYDGLMGEAHLCMAQAYGILQTERVADEYSRILEAIEAGDVQAAGDEMSGHLDRACLRLVSHMRAN